MKLADIYEGLTDEEIKKRAEAMKKRDQDLIRQRRSFEEPRKRSRLTGHGRGTASPSSTAFHVK